MSAVGQANPFSDASEYNTLDFIISRALDELQTVSIVEVQAVDTGAKTVDVQVLVNLVTGSNTPVVHEVIAARPYFRLQGGGNAIICDPQVGDIGVMVFASRDITGVVATKGAANPSSNRRFSWSDGLYFGGVLNAAPTQYIQFGSGGITVHSPTAVTIDAPTTTITGATTIDGNTTLQATLTANGASTFTAPVTLTSTLAGTSAVFSGSVTASSFIGGGGGGGSVTSVGISTPGVGVVVGGGPITVAGTLTIDLSSTAYAALALAVTALQTVSVQNSITGNGTTGSKLQLVNDLASPGANKVYGTDGSGVKGWQAAGGGGGVKAAVVPLYASSSSYVAPDFSAFTFIQQGVTGSFGLNADGVYEMLLPFGSANNLMSLVKSYAGGDFDVRMLTTHEGPAGQGGAWWFVLRDNTTGNMLSFGSQGAPATMNPCTCLLLTSGAGPWSSSTNPTYSSTVGALGGTAGDLNMQTEWPNWVRFTKVGSTYTFYISRTGDQWVQMGAVSNGLSANEFVIGTLSQDIVWKFYSLTGVPP